MQFITTGNRIAVENFTVGYLYTITFTNGDYIHTACTGIGIDFVMFSRTAPDYTFALTMDTAATVSTIDIYSEGGTMNYNELTNKPQINSVELVGNKTLNDLGIQPVINAEHMLSYTLVSGLGTAATTATTDYATAAQGALADTAVQPTALNDYQTLIDNDNKLSADLVDDTSTTNKFATSAQLGQIETNKNNILFNTNNGVKNLLKNTATSGSYRGIDYAINSDGTISTTGTTNANYFQLVIGSFTFETGVQYTLSGCPSGGAPNNYRITNSGAEFISDSGAGATVTGDGQTRQIIIYAPTQGTSLEGLTFKPMIRAASIADSTYMPYAPSNRELYEMILALQ